MKTIRRHTPIILFVSLIAPFLIGCHGSDDDDPAAAAETLERALAPREVQLVTAEIREERPSVQLVGEIRAFDTVTISSEVGGKVDRVGLVFVQVCDLSHLVFSCSIIRLLSLVDLDMYTRWPLTSRYLM